MMITMIMMITTTTITMITGGNTIGFRSNLTL